MRVVHLIVHLIHMTVRGAQEDAAILCRDDTGHHQAVQRHRAPVLRRQPSLITIIAMCASLTMAKAVAWNQLVPRRLYCSRRTLQLQSGLRVRWCPETAPICDPACYIDSVNGQAIQTLQTAKWCGKIRMERISVRCNAPPLCLRQQTTSTPTFTIRSGRQRLNVNP